MFQLRFVRGLFKFSLKTPALDWLFQLPPQIGTRFSRFPMLLPFSTCFFLVLLRVEDLLDPSSQNLSALFEFPADLVAC